MSPRIDYSSTAQLTLIGEVGPFALFSAVVERNLTSQQLFGASVDVEDEGSGTVAVFFKLFGILQFF